MNLENVVFLTDKRKEVREFPDFCREKSGRRSVCVGERGGTSRRRFNYWNNQVLVPGDSSGYDIAAESHDHPAESREFFGWLDSVISLGKAI